jgi:hypothetical protein
MNFRENFPTKTAFRFVVLLIVAAVIENHTVLSRPNR